MTSFVRFPAPPLTALGLSAAVLFAPMAVLSAPVAGAQPQCGNVSAQTTRCTTSGGSHQIVTTPPAMGQPTWPGFQYNYWDYPNYIVEFP